MNREYEFSVVVFAKDTAKLYRTFKNVREVTPEGTVQILAVCIAGDKDIPDERDMRELEEAGEKEKELKDEELDKIYGEFNPEDPRFREMLDDRDLLYIDGLECGDLVAELKPEAMLFLQKPESVFPQNPVQRSDAALRKKTEMLS